MAHNGTFFEASNGWQFRIGEDGFMRYRFRGDANWQRHGTQLGLGLIEWAQSPIWHANEE